MERDRSEHYELMSEEDYALYKFLIDFFKENGYAPSVREIAKAVYCSTSNVMPKLWRLQNLGKITVKQGMSRAIKLTEYEFVKKAD